MTYHEDNGTENLPTVEIRRILDSYNEKQQELFMKGFEVTRWGDVRKDGVYIFQGSNRTYRIVGDYEQVSDGNGGTIRQSRHRVQVDVQEGIIHDMDLIGYLEYSARANLRVYRDLFERTLEPVAVPTST